MRIAVSAADRDISSRVDQRLGRAAWFVIVDTETEGFESIRNLGVNEQCGAGPKAAELLADQNVDCVLTGHCGPNAFQALTAYGIDVIVGVEGTVEEAIERFNRGELTATDHADARGHEHAPGACGQGGAGGRRPSCQTEGGE